MSFTILGNTDFIASTATFSKSANDQLLMAMGQYKYYKQTVNSYIWDLTFVKTLDAFLAERLTVDDLNPSEYNTIQAFITYQDAMHAGTGTLDPAFEALDYLLLTTSLNGGY